MRLDIDQIKNCSQFWRELGEDNRWDCQVDIKLEILGWTICKINDVDVDIVTLIGGSIWTESKPSDEIILVDKFSGRILSDELREKFSERDPDPIYLVFNMQRQMVFVFLGESIASVSYL